MVGFELLAMLLIIPWTVFMWKTELKYYFDNMYSAGTSEWGIVRFFKGLWSAIVNLCRLFTDGKWFLIDMTVCMFLVSVFSMGQGLLGGLSGMFLSNCVSIVLLGQLNKERKQRSIYGSNTAGNTRRQ